MKAITLLGAAALALDGCSATSLTNALSYVNSGAAVIASVNGAMPAACASAAQIAGDVGTAVAKVGASNPNNASVQSVVAKVQSRTALTSTDCSIISAALAKL